MNLTLEWQLARKLQALGEPQGLDLFKGDTYFEQRREKCREMVKRWADVTFEQTESQGKTTMEQAFNRAYGCDL